MNKNLFFENRLLFKDPKVETKLVSPTAGKAAEAKKPAAEEVKQKEKEKAKAKATVKVDVKKSLTGVKTETELEKLKKSLKESKGKILTSQEILKEMTDKKVKMDKHLDWWKIGVRLRSHKEINPERWDPSSAKGLEEMYRDWAKLGIPIGDNFYSNVYKQLSKSFDKGQYKTVNPEAAQMLACQNSLRDPNNANYEVDAEFKSCRDFFLHMKNTAQGKTKWDLAMRENIQNRNREPIFSKGIDFVRDNVGKFKEAIQNRDYSTAAMYVFGIYALYKAYKTLPEAKRGQLSKYFFWGAAAYAGTYFAKNAGYDVLKKLGFKKPDAEVYGTPMAAFTRLDIKPNGETIDSGLARDMALVNLKDLQKAFKETNVDEVGWIDPKRFSYSLKGWDYGEGRPSDVRAKNLSPKARKYKEVGHKIYIMYLGLKEAYVKTMGKKSPGRSLEDALNDPTLKFSTIGDFMSEVERYAPEYRESKTLFDTKQSEHILKRFNGVFTGRFSKLGMSLDTAPLKPGYFNMRLMGYPMVARINSATKHYQIFAKSDYEKSGGNPTNPLAEIPFTGNAEGALETLRNGVTDKMLGLMAVFNTTTGTGGGLIDPRYNENGYWEATLKYDLKKNLLKGAQKPVTVKITTSNGKDLDVRSMTNEVIVHLKDAADTEKIYGSLVLSQLCAQRGSSKKQTDFSALRWFYRKDTLRFIDQDPNDEFFYIQIGSVSIGGKNKFKMKFDGTKYMFVDDNGKDISEEMEKKFLQDHTFRAELSESVGTTEEVEEVVKNFQNILKNTPKSYFIHFFKNIPNWFKGMSWHYPLGGLKLSQFTGSVPQLYMMKLVESQKDLILAKFRTGIATSGRFSEISEKQNSVVRNGIAKLRQLNDKFVGLNLQNQQGGKDFSAGAFDTFIVDDLLSVGIESNTYKDWYRAFVDGIHLQYGMDNLREGRAFKAHKLIAAYLHHTNVADKKSMDGIDPNFRISAVTKKEIGLVEKAIADVRKTKKDSKYTPSDSEIQAFLPPTSGMNLTEIGELRKIMDKLERYRDYRLYRGYTKYVAYKIYGKIQASGINGTFPSPDSSEWGIDDFEQYKLRHEFRSVEYIDSEPLMKMRKDHITLDKYLKLSMAERANQGYTANDVILPLYPPPDPLVFKYKEDLDIYNRLRKKTDDILNKRGDVVGSQGEVTGFTPFSQYFYDEIHKAFAEIQKRFKPKAEFRKLLVTAFLPRYEDQIIPCPGQPIVKFRYSPKRSTFYNQLQMMEKELSLRSYKTLTATDQKYLVHQYVGKIIEKMVLNPVSFNKYFDDTSLYEQFKNWVKSKFKG